MELNKIVVICGHYGVGKTNVAVNMAICSASSELKTYLADLDIVNPYFRAADASDMMKRSGVVPLIPAYANSNVDIPSLPDGLASALSGDGEGRVFIDVGGDDGAVVLGRYSDVIRAKGYDMLYVVNKYRPLISEPRDAIDFMREIESLSRLKCTGIVNNSSIGDETKAKDFAESIPYALECANISGLPLVLQSYFEENADGIEALLKSSDYYGETLAMKRATKKLF